jgi:hypothetical protein
MNIQTCTSYPDNLLEPYRPAGDVQWDLVISGGWSQDRYHSGHIAYYMAKADNVWIMDSVARAAELDGVTEEDIEAGRLNDDQLQSLWGTTLEEAQAVRYKRIVAVCCDAPPEADEHMMAHALYKAVKRAGGRVVDDPDADWDDYYDISLTGGAHRTEMLA